MAYRNARDIFPEGLLRQIQKYVSGETIYIPAGVEKKDWGRPRDISSTFVRGTLRSGRHFRAERRSRR